MNDFTYLMPFSNEKLLAGIIYQLKHDNQYDIANLLKNCRMEVEEGGYSHYDGGGRWDAHSVYITFYVNPANIDFLDTPAVKRKLTDICSGLIPANVGFDVKDTYFKLDLTKDFDLEDDLILDLEQKTNSISAGIINDILPEDIKIKGYHMAEAYIYLYCVENSLRLFIEKVCKERYGETYFSQITVPKALQNTLQTRKENAKNKKWLSVRGSELFYLDFKDLGNLIDNNWNLFSPYFPDRAFIVQKINEMGDCRNLIAHNSYVGETERGLIKTYYSVILKQISAYYEKNN